jgi:hypothetical protein
LGQVEALPALLSESGELCIGPETYAMVADFADAAVSLDAVQAAIGVYQARRRRARAPIYMRAPICARMPRMPARVSARARRGGGARLTGGARRRRRR